MLLHHVIVMGTLFGGLGLWTSVLVYIADHQPNRREHTMLRVEIECDGVNPAVYTIPEGVSLTVADWGDNYFRTVEGPFKGEWPEREDEETKDEPLSQTAVQAGYFAGR